MRIIKPRELAALAKFYFVPEFAENRCERLHSVSVAKYAKHRISMLTFATDAIILFLLGFACAMGVVIAQGSTNVMAISPIAVVAAIGCLTAAGFVGILRLVQLRTYKKGFGGEYSELAGYLGTAFLGKNPIGDIRARAHDRLREAGDAMDDAEKDFGLDPEDGDRRYRCEYRRYEFERMYAAMRRFGLVDEKLGWDPFLPERKPVQIEQAETPAEQSGPGLAV